MPIHGWCELRASADMGPKAYSAAAGRNPAPIRGLTAHVLPDKTLHLLAGLNADQDAPEMHGKLAMPRAA